MPRLLATRSLVPITLLAALAAAVLLVLPGPSGATGPCTITWVGDVNGSWQQNTAGNTNWNDNTLPLADDRVCIPATGSQPVTLSGSSTTVTDYEISAGASLVLAGGIFLRAKADSINAGTISLTGAGSLLQAEDGTVAGTETLTNTGTISVPVGGTAGARAISGNVLNQGTITIANTTSFSRISEDTGPKLTNTGTLTVASGGALRVLDAALEQQPGATINGPGKITVEGGSSNPATLRRLILAGGTIAANADVNLIRGGPALQFAGGSPTGRVHVADDSGDHVIEGDIPAGFTVDLADRTKLIAAANLTNAGTLNLFGGTSRLEVAGDFVNSGSLSVSVQPKTPFVTGFSSIAAGKAARLGGQLLVTTTLAPEKAERRIISSASRTGSFASTSFVGAFHGVAYDAKGVTLSGPVPLVQGQTVAAGPVTGVVKVRLKGSNRFTTLTDTAAIPVGSELDTTRGTMAVSSVARAPGTTQTAEFRAGRFTVAQTRSSPLTTVALSGAELKSCAKSGRASAAAKRKPTRRLFGSGKGTFTTKGRYGTATIRGTRWLVQDFCDRTVFKSLDGTVSVRDAVKRKTVTLKRGRSYTARRP